MTHFYYKTEFILYKLGFFAYRKPCVDVRFYKAYGDAVERKWRIKIMGIKDKPLILYKMEL